MTTAFLYLTLCTAAYYLVARAKITSFLWRRYPAWLEYWVLCAACSGLWYGLGCAALGYHYDLPLFGLPPDSALGVVSAGALGMVWTPVAAYAMVYAWSGLFGTDDDEGDSDA
jgi:hypothetical protein